MGRNHQNSTLVTMDNLKKQNLSATESSKLPSFSIGERVLMVMESQGRSVESLADELGMGSDQLSLILQQPGIDIALLMDISVALNHNFLKDCAEVMSAILNK